MVTPHPQVNKLQLWVLLLRIIKTIFLLVTLLSMDVESNWKQNKQGQCKTSNFAPLEAEA